MTGSEVACIAQSLVVMSSLQELCVGKTKMIANSWY